MDKGAIFGRRCAECGQVEIEPAGRKLFGGPEVQPVYRCGAPGPKRGYIVGEVERPLPYIPAWCPRIAQYREEANHANDA